MTKKPAKDGQQKIIEAQANLEVAKLLQAIDSLKIGTIEFATFYNSDIEKSKKIVNTVLNMVSAAEQFKKHCENFQDIKLVTNLVDGIKLKSKYELEINSLKERLIKGSALFKESTKRYDELVARISTFVKTGEQPFLGDVKPLSEYLDRCCDYLSAQECNFKNETSF